MNLIDGESQPFVERYSGTLVVIILVLLIGGMYFSHKNARSETKEAFQKEYIILEESDETNELIVANRQTGIIYFADHKVDTLISIRSAMYGEDQLPMKIKLDGEY